MSQTDSPDEREQDHLNLDQYDIQGNKSGSKSGRKVSTGLNGR